MDRYGRTKSKTLIYYHYFFSSFCHFFSMFDNDWHRIRYDSISLACVKDFKIVKKMLCFVCLLFSSVFLWKNLPIDNRIKPYRFYLIGRIGMVRWREIHSTIIKKKKKKNLSCVIVDSFVSSTAFLSVGILFEHSRARVFLWVFFQIKLSKDFLFSFSSSSLEKKMFLKGPEKRKKNKTQGKCFKTLTFCRLGFSKITSRKSLQLTTKL